MSKTDTFATLIELFSSKKVTYYTVQPEKEEETLYAKFLNNHQAEEFAEDLATIRFWLKKIGREIGAQEKYFRPEQAASALPPPAKYLDLPCDLRLYCMRVNRNAVIFFNGAKKTTREATDCPNCGPLFRQANKLTRQIDKKIAAKEIVIDSETGDLIFDADLILKL